MNTKPTLCCFFPYTDSGTAEAFRRALKEDSLNLSRESCVIEQTAPPLCSTEGLRAAAYLAGGFDYVLLCTRPVAVEPGYHMLERLVQVAEQTDTGMVYADHYNVVGGKRANAPVIDYQAGSLRDDFDFGSVLMFNAAAFKDAVARMDKEYEFAGLYDLRLKVSQKAEIVHINEYLYSDVELDTRKSGEKIFDYVDPKNRGVQIEMEDACTAHLKAVGGYLEPKFKKIEFSAGNFEYEASVIIPVRNRIRTIRDAIKSVLNQKADFKFNLIVIDNHSTDGTTEAIDEFKAAARSELCDGELALTAGDVAAIETVERDTYALPAFIYGKDPRHTLTRRRRIEGVGTVETRLEVRGGVIKGASLCGDFFATGNVDALMQRLVGVRLEREAVVAALPERVDDVVMNLGKDDLVNLLLRER